MYMLEFDGKDMMSLQWIEIKMGDMFEGRWGHSVVQYRKKLYIFG